MGFEKIRPEEMSGNPFEVRGKDWFLISAGSEQKLNMMTGGWGYLGVFCGKPSAVVLVRPSRYTYEFINDNDYFTVSFYGSEYRPQLSLLGSKSGRDIDKVAESKLTPAFAECGAPYFEEADLVLVCKKIFEKDLTEADVPEDDKKRFFPAGDYHKLYFTELIEILERR